MYRTIHSSDESTNYRAWQLIAEINAEDEQVALERAKFIKIFTAFDGTQGIVIDAEQCQPECKRAANVQIITATHYGNECLARQQKLLDDEVNAHDRRMSVLNDEFQSMLASM
ncbi:MAG: hypothetical protein JXR12_05755 [Neptunomonas phycophila]|uniref:hypothetical protein n=1 Tax=Neptunomonas phycophila TaxID=1572645 RepID=UPI003B8CEC7D